jgi:hypothetical protein
MNDEPHDVLNRTLAAITVLFLAGVVGHFVVEYGFAAKVLHGMLAIAAD